MPLLRNGVASSSPPPPKKCITRSPFPLSHTKKQQTKFAMMFGALCWASILVFWITNSIILL